MAASKTLYRLVTTGKFITSQYHPEDINYHFSYYKYRDSFYSIYYYKGCVEEITMLDNLTEDQIKNSGLTLNRSK